MTPNEAKKLGRNSAHEAIDQVDVYGSLNNALAAYWENLADTCTTTHKLQLAQWAFLAFLSERDISYDRSYLN